MSDSVINSSHIESWQPKIWLLQPDAKRAAQSVALANNLTITENITQISESEMPEINYDINQYTDIAIGCGSECQQKLIDIKKLAGEHIKTVSILDNGKFHNEFDLIITPSYEPHSKAVNIIETIGLLNHVNDNLLEKVLEEYDQSSRYNDIKHLLPDGPYITVLLGGHHTGGNINTDDAEKIAQLLNSLSARKQASLLITTSARSQAETIEALKNKLKVPHLIYDYKYGRSLDNPYLLFLALADDIVVTGDSVRMMSEACSSGKNVFIYDSANIGFQYKTLVKQLIEQGYANSFTKNKLKEKITKQLKEAERTAKIIKQKFYA